MRITREEPHAIRLSVTNDRGHARSCRPRSRGAQRPSNTSGSHKTQYKAPRDARAATGTSPCTQAQRQMKGAEPPAREVQTKGPRGGLQAAVQIEQTNKPPRTKPAAIHNNQLGAHFAMLATSHILSRALGPEPIAAKHLEVTKHLCNKEPLITNKRDTRRKRIRKREHRRERERDTK